MINSGFYFKKYAMTTEIRVSMAIGLCSIIKKDRTNHLIVKH